ncbi:DNA adenine methylase [Rubrobacter xylanophilus DSM 9941]|uniref:site-specific DNA-methyltransferase (adenine-specific) n=1 Tax=Rubrobacter xylanophilus (strain DSM 9941 / JCM 11954 / NBRC 16129 / PRD-1) TaxID=266117 RepID=Q1AUY7_RUBXD|nr:Dam family site-specific DNA-(adenine-N6)-methyltransferase [Rubrobacter xylanophilus]ABG04791.1 DNA adenine methylase [Rubrobacter xylanophilus DSM 9941]
MLTDDRLLRDGEASESTVEPFLRWAGGKRWLASTLAPIIKSRLRGTYIEPFLGSGAMFFAVAPEKALLSDLNADLVGAFRAVAERPDELLEEVRALPVNAETYYKLRADEPLDPLQRAVRFVYLNRTCYGGIYRENKRGVFNTPYGGGSRTPAPLWERALIERCSPLLRKGGITLEVSDFELSLDAAGEGDVVYCDPAYRAATRAHFDRYGAVVFGWEDQVRLAAAARRAGARGALVIISNTYCPEVRELYGDVTRILLEKTKAIGNAAKDPNRCKEYLIVLDPEDDEGSARAWETVGRIER